MVALERLGNFRGRNFAVNLNNQVVCVKLGKYGKISVDTDRKIGIIKTIGKFENAGTIGTIAKSC